MQHRMKNFQLTQDQISSLLQRADIGRLGTIRKDGFPYVVAMHFVYSDGNIYMHGLPKGLKIDNINHDPKACFEVDEIFGLQWEGNDIPCNTEAVYNSVVLTGTAHTLEEFDLKKKILNKLAEKYTPQFTGHEIPEKMIKGTAVIELRVEECTGKYHK